jgi:hypothetical protein
VREEDMNGIILMELSKYVEAKLGQGAWERLLQDNGIGARMYVPLENYPDQEAVALVTAAAQRTGNAEETIHEVIRRVNPKANPPRLKCERPSPEEVVIHYASPRKMCGVAKGIAKGIANHYGERVALMERACMHRGAPHCEISVKLLP